MGCFRMGTILFWKGEGNRRTFFSLSAALTLIGVSRLLHLCMLSLPEYFFDDLTLLLIWCFFWFTGGIITIAFGIIALLIMLKSRGEKRYISLYRCLGLSHGHIQIIEMTQYGWIIFYSVVVSRIVSYVIIASLGVGMGFIFQVNRLILFISMGYEEIMVIVLAMVFWGILFFFHKCWINRIPPGKFIQEKL